LLSSPSKSLKLGIASDSIPVQIAQNLTPSVERVATALDLDPAAIRHSSKARLPAKARGIICYLAVREFGFKGQEIGRKLPRGYRWHRLAGPRCNSEVGRKRALMLLKGDKLLNDLPFTC
jgi:hypothetical protein